jgi:uncharacterized repeat protein (TIGR03847 family)
MASSFDIPDADQLTTGAVGPPGQRVFYLQARAGSQVLSLKLEKTQVAALCRYLETMLADLPAPGELPTDLDLVEPVVPEWVVGSLGVTYDEEADRIVLVAEELVGEEEAEGEGGARPASARIRATREQVAAFCRHGTQVVLAGRPPCPWCGGPLDPEGHVCVRMNGHRGLTR